MQKTHVVKEVKDKTFTIKIPESLLDKLRDQALQDSRTMAAQALVYIRDGLAKEQP